MKFVFFDKWNAWWIVKDAGLTCQLLYGPFGRREAELAGDIHGIEFK